MILLERRGPFWGGAFERNLQRRPLSVGEGPARHHLTTNHRERPEQLANLRVPDSQTCPSPPGATDSSCAFPHSQLSPLSDDTSPVTQGRSPPVDAGTNMLGFKLGAYPSLRLICLSAKWNS